MTYFSWISELEYLLKEDMKLFLHDILEYMNSNLLGMPTMY